MELAQYNSMKTTNCLRCENSGIYYKPNGESDFDVEYCSCFEGQRAEKLGAMRVLQVDFQQSKGTPDIFLIG